MVSRASREIHCRIEGCARRRNPAALLRISEPDIISRIPMAPKRGHSKKAQPSRTTNAIPLPTVRRLSLYLRQLETLWRADQHTVSSKQLGAALKVTDTQIRKDLAYFGQFGHPGVGYDVAELTTTIRRILGTDRTWNVLLVGAGNLGSALSAYRGFAKKGFKLVAVFDVDPRKIGKPISSNAELIVQPLSDAPKTIRQRDIRLAINAVPAEAAQEVADILVRSGIQGLFNFAPVNLNLASNVAVSTIDLAVQLEQLSFRVGLRQSVGDRILDMSHEI